MPSELNKLMVKEFADQFKDIGEQGCVVVSCIGMKAVDNVALREELRQRGVQMRQVKNRIMRLALADLKTEAVGELLEGPSAILTGEDGGFGIAKLVKEAAKRYEKLTVLGAFVEDKVYKGKEFDALTALPGREELLARVGAGINGPARSMAIALSGLARKIALALAGVRDQLEKAETPAG